MIDNLQIEVCRLRKELADKESQLSIKPAERKVDDELSLLNILSQQTSENLQERINLQKALFELEETNLRNCIELQHLDDSIAKQQEIVANEKHRCQLQDMIEESISNNGNKTYLHILSQYRLLGMANTELQFEMAMRNQVLHNQREAQRNLRNLIMGFGLDQKQILETASKQGITIEDWTATSHRGSTSVRKSSAPCYGRLPSFWSSPSIGQSYSSSSCVFQHQQKLGSSSCVRRELDSAHTVCREEHQSSYFLMSHDHSPTAYLGISSSSEHWVSSGRQGPWLCSPEKPTRDVCCSYPDMRNQSSPVEGSVSTLPLPQDFGRNKGACNTNRWQLPEFPQFRPNTGHSPRKEITSHHSGATQSLFVNNLSELSGRPSSRHVFHSITPSNSQDPSQLQPCYTAAGKIPFITATSPDTKGDDHCTSFV